MINFCHIAPTAHLSDFCSDNKVHLILAHLVETDPIYTEWYRNAPGYKILDNSAFEMYKQNRLMYDPDKLIEMGRAVNADVIVMSDYPNVSSKVTIDAAEMLAPQFHEAGFKTFFVPQSEKGDLYDYLQCYDYATNNPLIDFVGVSILGAPNAFGEIEKDNKLQRFLSRWKIMTMLENHNMLDPLIASGTKIHFLGALDGWPGEAQLMHSTGFSKHIFSWDSSGAVWSALHGDIVYDSSPTGQLGGKYEEEVDFKFSTNDQERIAKAHSNIAYLAKFA